MTVQHSCSLRLNSLSPLPQKPCSQGSSSVKRWGEKSFGGGETACDAFSCWKPRWSKAKRISHKDVFCAVAMTAKSKGQMLSWEELPITSRNQISDATVCKTLAYEQLHLGFMKIFFSFFFFFWNDCACPWCKLLYNTQIDLIHGRDWQNYGDSFRAETACCWLTGSNPWLVSAAGLQCPWGAQGKALGNSQ